MSGSRVMSPSIENTPSVQMKRWRAEEASLSAFSRALMSECGYTFRCALHRRMLSMILAWFRASEMTASFSSRQAGISPSFAFQHET